MKNNIITCENNPFRLSKSGSTEEMRVVSLSWPELVFNCHYSFSMFKKMFDSIYNIAL